MIAQQRGHVQEHVVEIDRTGGEQLGLIARVDLGDDVADRLPGFGSYFSAVMRLFLAQLMAACSRSGVTCVSSSSQCVDDPLEHGEAVAGVVDRVVLLQADVAGVLPEEPGAKAVKRAHPDLLAGREHGQATLHLVGGLVGEGEGDDLPGGDALGQQVRDAVRDDARLAAAGAGEDQQRAVDVGDSFALGVGEGVEQSVQTMGS